ncbi:MAG: Bug family tripartite tricarboxylate transporter substrate binding protein [Lautropia sp.]
MRRFTSLFAAAALIVTVAGPARAADVIKLVVPFAAGGPGDQTARLIAPGLGKHLGKRVIIENRGGAGATIGVNHVAKSPPDGETLLMTTASLVFSAGTRATLPYDPRRDVEPIFMIGEVQTIVVVRPSLGVNNYQEFLARAKSGKSLSYGSTGVGSTMHIGAEMLAKAAQIPLLHVPYTGAAPALVDLIAGNVDLVNADVPVLRPYILDNRLKGLVVFDTKRSSLVPNVPSAADVGQPELMMSNWYGVFAPRGTPPELRKQIEDAMAKAVAEPDTAARLAEGGFAGPLGSVPFKAMLDREFDRWVPWLKAAGIRTE